MLSFWPQPKPEVATYLVRCGADLTATDRFGHSVLYYAGWTRVTAKPSAITALLESHGARLNAADKRDMPLFSATAVQ